MVKFINKQELKYIGIAGAFGFLYFLYLLPWFLKNGIENSSPYIQFLLFSIGIYFLYFFMFKSWSLGTKQSLGASVIGVIPFLTFDLLAPEYHINLINGTLEKGATLGSASIDYNLGYLFNNLGFYGWIIVPLVYFVSFIILLILTAFIKKNFVKELN